MYTKNFLKGFLLSQLLSLVRRRTLNYTNAIALGAFTCIFPIIRSKTSTQTSAILSSIILTLLDPSILSQKVLSVAITRYIFDKVGHLPLFSEVMMCINASHILSTFLTNQNIYLDKSYHKFLKKQSIIDVEAINSKPIHFNQVHLAITNSRSFHLQFFVHLFLKAWIVALKLYAPMYFVFFLFRKNKNIKHILIDLIRSSTFLSTYVTFGLFSLSTISYNRIYNVKTKYLTLLPIMWLSGTALLIERKQRRSTISAYCTVYSIDSLLSRIKINKYLLNLLYVLSLSYIICSFSRTNNKMVKFILSQK